MDDLTIFDNEKTSEYRIYTYLNYFHKHLEFIPTQEENGQANYMDLTTDTSIPLLQKYIENQQALIQPHIIHKTTLWNAKQQLTDT